VDNIPPALIGQLIDLLADQQQVRRVAAGVDVRTGRFLEGAGEMLDGLVRSGAPGRTDLSRESGRRARAPFQRDTPLPSASHRAAILGEAISAGA